MLMVFNLLGKCVGKPREASCVHPHREIAALGIGRADVRGIRVALDNLCLAANAFGGAVAARSVRRLAIDFD